MLIRAKCVKYVPVLDMFTHVRYCHVLDIFSSVRDILVIDIFTRVTYTIFMCVRRIDIC